MSDLAPTTTPSTLSLSPTPSVTLASTSTTRHNSHPLITFTTGSDSAEEERTLNGHVQLYTTYRGHVYRFDKDPFTPEPYRVMGCVQPPPVMLAVGTRVVLKPEGVEGMLTKVHEVVKGRVRFRLQPHDPHHACVVLQVRLQYARLPWYWQARVGIYQLIRWRSRLEG